MHLINLSISKSVQGKEHKPNQSSLKLLIQNPNGGGGGNSTFVCHFCSNAAH